MSSSFCLASPNHFWPSGCITTHAGIHIHARSVFFFKCIGRSETSVDEDSKIEHGSQQDQRAKGKGSALWEERVSDVLPGNRASVTMMEMGV